MYGKHRWKEPEPERRQRGRGWNFVSAERRSEWRRAAEQHRKRDDGNGRSRSVLAGQGEELEVGEKGGTAELGSVRSWRGKEKE